MNICTMTGRLTKDPELRYTTGSSALAVTAFTVACDRGKNKNGDKVTDFVPCKAWGKTAELICKYLKKGAKVGCVGHIETGSFTKKDGTKGFSVEVNVEKVEFLDRLEDKKEPVPEFEEIPEEEKSEMPF